MLVIMYTLGAVLAVSAIACYWLARIVHTCATGAKTANDKAISLTAAKGSGHYVYPFYAQRMQDGHTRKVSEPSCSVLERD